MKERVTRLIDGEMNRWMYRCTKKHLEDSLLCLNLTAIFRVFDAIFCYKLGEML